MFHLQEIQRQKTLHKEQEKLEDIRVMEYIKEKEVRWTCYSCLLERQYLKDVITDLSSRNVKKSILLNWRDKKLKRRRKFQGCEHNRKGPKTNKLNGYVKNT